MEHCLYAGQNQAAPLYETLDDTVNSPVIFGVYTDYRVDAPYATDFSYTHFEESRSDVPNSILCNCRLVCI